MAHSRQVGRANARSGSSHSAYCGEYTLLTMRNNATTRNATWPTRGLRGARKMSAPIPRQPSIMRMSDHIPGVGTPMPASDITYQIDPRSAPRSTLNCQKYIQPEGDAKNTGAF